MAGLIDNLRMILCDYFPEEERAEKAIGGYCCTAGSEISMPLTLRNYIADEIRAARCATIEECVEAVGKRLRQWEHELEEKHVLHGRPVTREVVEGMPLIRQSAEIARVRLTTIEALRALLDEEKT